MQKSVRLLENISEISGRIVAWLVLALVALTLLVAIPRYVLSNEWFLQLHLLGIDWEALRGHYSRNVNAMNDGVQYLHAIIFMIGIAYAMKLGDHVRIDILYRRMSDRTRAWVDLLGTLFFLYPTFIFILYVSWDYVLASWQVVESSPRPGGLAYVYLLKSLLIIMPALMLLQGTALLLRSVLQLRNQPMPDTPHEHGEL